MSSFIEKLFGENTSKKKVDPSTSIINEAIIMDQIGKDKMPDFYKNIGNYGERDGLLGNKPIVSSDDKMCKHGKIAAILELARKNNDPDYEMFMKAAQVKKMYLTKLAEKYSKDADNVVGQQIQILNGNARVQDAITKTECTK